MAEKEPLNMKLLDINSFIKENNIKEVTSVFVHESGSPNKFDPNGLYAEEIFGAVASQQRLVTPGYISLHCRVFHPVIFRNLYLLKRFYTEIMSGETFAAWDADTGDFIRATEGEKGASTGYSFFMKYFDKINWTKNSSLKRNDKIDVIEKYKKERIIDKIIVIPAGIRDFHDDEAGQSKDVINKIYVSLINNARAMTAGADTNPLFDSVHYIIQKKVNEVYDAIETMVKGKRGFFESKYAAREVAQGTRNVITATDMRADNPMSPQYHKLDETRVPLYQAAKGGANFVVFQYKALFYDQILNMSSDNIPLINPKNLRLEYVNIDPKDKDKLLLAEGIEKTIDRFRDEHTRFKPVVVHADKKPYYLYLVYEEGDEIYILRSIDEFKQQRESAGHKFDQAKVRPLTHAEMLYIATFFAYVGKHATTTRYPVTDEQSIFVSKVHVMSTVPARIVKLMKSADPKDGSVVLPEYPIEGNKFCDALLLHPTRLKSLGADFDGNCLVGETRVEIRFTDMWIDMVKSAGLNYDNFDDVVKSCDHIDNRINASIEGWNYAEIEMGSFPAVGDYVLDKNGARVYNVPEGCEILSYSDNKPVYLPIEKFTVEDDCPVVDIQCGGRKATVSTNPSLAAFGADGKIVKLSPGQIGIRFTPYIKKAFIPESRGMNTEGYDAGYKMACSVEDIKMAPNFMLRVGNDEYAAGYLAGLIEKFASFKKSIISSYNCDVVFECKDDREVDAVVKAMYMLGIRYILPVAASDEDPNPVKDVLINAYDLKDLKSKLKFKSRVVQSKMNKVFERRPYIDADPIPVTEAERSALGKAAGSKGDYNLMYKMCNKNHIDRKAAKELVKSLDPVKFKDLIARINATDICWARTVLSSKRRATVYDFLVSKSKLFSVNNGLIVFDTCSWIPVQSNEANEECARYIHTVGNYILPSGEPIADMLDDLCKLSLRALTRPSPEMLQKKK